MGIENECNTPGSGVRDIIEGCPEFDLIVASHTHRQIPGELINDTLVVENKSGAETMMVVDVELSQDEGRWCKRNITSSCVKVSDFPPEPSMMDELAPYDQRAREDAVRQIGKLVGGPLEPKDETPGIREAWVRDTALIDLIGHAMMHYAEAPVASTALSQANARLREGAIRKCDTALIYKYGNMLYKVRMTGSQLKRYMEWSARFFNTFHPGDLTLSFNPYIPPYDYDFFVGLKYEIDISREPGSRICGLSWPDGRLVRDDEYIDLATYDFRANHLLLVPSMLFDADDMPQLLAADVRGDIGGIRELVGDYITNVKGGLIAPDRDDNWRISGYHWDEKLHQEVVELLESRAFNLHSMDPNAVWVGCCRPATESDLLAARASASKG